MMLSVFNLLLFILSLNPVAAKPASSIIEQISPSKPYFFTTGWESITSWQSANNGGTQQYTCNRSTPEIDNAIIEEGAVIVFVKGYDLEGFSTSASKPLSLPFYLSSATETATASYQWQTVLQPGIISIQLQLPQTLQAYFDGASKNVQARYFVLSKAFLQQHKLSTQTAHQLSYNQLVQLLGIAA